MLSRKTLPRLLASASTVLVVLLVLAACGDTSTAQNTFGSEGPVADRQLSLFKFIFWLAVVVFIFVEGLIVFMLFRFRRKPGQQGLPPQTHGNTRLEIIWTFIPVVILVAIAVPTYITIADQRKPSSEYVKSGKVMKVEVVAHQWWWEFRYPDLGVVTANELHVPIDTAVDTTLHSQDVIHSFWIPKLAGTVDVIPGRSNRMWFVAKDPGVTYYGQCKELCGISHANMRFRVMSETQEDFEKWVAGQKAPPQQPESELAKRGAQLFGAKGCLVCHTVNGPDAAGIQESRMNGFLKGSAIFPAPNLTSLGIRTTFAGGIIDNNTDNLRRWLKDPEEVKPGNHMGELAAAFTDPNLKLSDADIEALVAYLQSLKPDLTAAGRPTPTPAPTAPPSGTPSASPAPTSGPVQIATVGNDLKFDRDKITVSGGAKVTVRLKNNAGSAALQHNWVLVKQGQEDAVAAAGLAAGAGSDWVPRNNPNVIASMKLVDGGKSGEVTFTAPAPGVYAYICSFPGHNATMHGVFEVTQ